MARHLIDLIPNWVAPLGRVTAIQPTLYILDLTVFVIRAFRDWHGRVSLLNRATYRSLVTQLIFTGIDALPAITLLAFLLGVSLITQLVTWIEVFGSKEDIDIILSSVVVNEVAPIMTALVLMGRSGSAITVDLGNMKLHGEVEGLELLAINVNHFFVTPRLIGGAIAHLVLAIYFSAISVIGGLTAAGLLFNIKYFSYLRDIWLAFDPVSLIFFSAKNLFFGLIIATTACYHGLSVGRSPTEVPQQTQKAIIRGLLLIFFVDGIFAVSAP